MSKTKDYEFTVAERFINYAKINTKLIQNQLRFHPA